MAALEGRRALRAEQELKRIAERATAEQLASEERYRQLYTATPAMLHAIDLQGRLTYVSKQWLDTLGYARDEVLGRASVEFLTEDSRQKARLAVKELFSQGRFDDLALNMVCKDGKVIDVLLSAVLERDAAGQPLRGVAYLRDVTASLRSERALQAERQRLAWIIEGTGAGTWEWNVQTGDYALQRALGPDRGGNAEGSVAQHHSDLERSVPPRRSEALWRTAEGPLCRRECRI